MSAFFTHLTLVGVKHAWTHALIILIRLRFDRISDALRSIKTDSVITSFRLTHQKLLQNHFKSCIYQPSITNGI